MTKRDQTIERQLDAEVEKLIAATTRVDRIRAADHIRELVSWRSLVRVSEMERERGLR